jgi:plastocyanin
MAWAASSAPLYRVSQSGRDFHPKEVTIRRGEAVQVINDDGDLLHHVYISSSQFNYDSDDMEPGGKVDIEFPFAGDFNVLCAIHPKMKLVVTVK